MRSMRGVFAVNKRLTAKTALVALLFALGQAGYAETWRFALIGDTPYNDYERAELPKMIDAIGQHHPAFIAHIGDIKSGRTRCDDSRFLDRYQVFNASPVPFIYVPGDNEWTDCDRPSNGSYDPEERLATLRRIFWKDNQSLGQQKITVEQQSAAYPEHSRFRLGPVLFVSLNVPGSDNNRGPSERPNREFLQRHPQVLAWISDSFKLARREKLAGIVIMFQADPDFERYAKGISSLGYREFLDTLKRETERFPGQVVAVHGDTHWSRIDHPLRDKAGQRLANFTRVETHGYPLMGWTQGFIDSDAPGLFRFETYAWPPQAR